ncbi:MAG: hypothetical protein Q9217_003198 [Psora testacea]
MKKATILTPIVVLLRCSFAAILDHGQENYPSGQLIYQPADETQEHNVAAYLQAPSNAESIISEEPLRPSSHSADPKDLQKQSEKRRSEYYRSSSPDPGSHHLYSIGAIPGSSRWAMVYFPYNDDLTCKNLLTVRSDIATIARKGFTTIRLHATDCSALYKVGEAAQLYNMRMILGVHIDETGTTTAASQVQEMINWAQGTWDAVEMVVIGEETIFNEFVRPDNLAALIASSRRKLRAAGYTGPVTTTEPIPTLYENGAELCPVIDLPAANIHPFFHPEVASDTAGLYVAHALTVLGNICPGKSKAVNLETGWPSRGVPNGRAVPGRVEQMVAMDGIMRDAGHRSVVLGFGDDGWKDKGELEVEGAWGCEGLFG